MAKARAIAKFTNSLTEYLLNVMADKYSDVKSFAYRYNNLKVYMDPLRVSEPHFWVVIGISEACFAIDTAKKIEGSLGNEDGYVMRWCSRPNIWGELKNHWKLVKDAATAETADDVHKKSIAIVELERTETSNDKLKVDITATGIDRTKRLERERKKRLKTFKKNTTATNKKKRK